MFCLMQFADPIANLKCTALHFSPLSFPLRTSHYHYALLLCHAIKRNMRESVLSMPLRLAEVRQAFSERLIDPWRGVIAECSSWTQCEKCVLSLSRCTLSLLLLSADFKPQSVLMPWGADDTAAPLSVINACPNKVLLQDTR